MSSGLKLRERLRRALFENLGLKLLSLATAIALYVFIHGTDNAHRALSLSVVSLLPSEAANRQLLTPLPTEVVVTLRGSRGQLDDLHAEDLGSVQLDLQDGRKAKVILEPSMIHVPPGVRVTDFHPKEIALRWDDVVTRPLPVHASRTGEPLPGRHPRALSIEPAVVSARGPKSALEALQFARPAAFDASGLSEGVHKRKLPLERPSSLVSWNVDDVTATLVVEAELVPREFQHRKVEVLGGLKAAVLPSHVNVKLWGIASELSALPPEQVVPRVDPRSLSNVDLTKPGSALADVSVVVVGKEGESPPKLHVTPPKVLLRW